VFATSFARVQTDVAGLTRIQSWDNHHRHTGRQRFVGNEELQLIEGPAIAAPPLFLGPGLGVGALSDPAQVFQGNAPSGCLGGLDNAPADQVVDVPLEKPFTPRQPFQA
jgi:hypothetical protein